MSRTKTFASAIAACRTIANHYRHGLQAVPKRDRRRLQVAHPRRVAGSIALDDALRPSLPTSPRWDYGVGYIRSGGMQFVHWIEVHPGTQGEIKSMEAKLRWLRSWLASEATHLEQLPRCFVWVSSGRTSLSPQAPGRKQLAQLGLIHVGGSYTIE